MQKSEKSAEVTEKARDKICGAQKVREVWDEMEPDRGVPPSPLFSQVFDLKELAGTHPPG